MGRTIVVIDAASDPRLARDLSAGGAFVTGYALALSDECELVVRNASTEVRLAARVVYVDPSRGAGLELVGFSSVIRDELAELIGGLEMARPSPNRIPTGSSPPLTRPTGSSPALQPDNGSTRAAVSASSIEAARRVANRGRTSSKPLSADGATTKVDAAGDLTDSILTLEPPAHVDETDAEIDDAAGDDSDELALPQTAAQKTMHARLRGLTIADQLKLAHAGEIAERVLLERLYGKTVWEALLRNPRLTAPEVARIARMGALPRILIEIIVGNGSWLQMPDVRRALLTNPRLGTDQVTKVLRLMPKPELRLVPTQTALPIAVRDVARRLLRGD